MGRKELVVSSFAWKISCRKFQQAAVSRGAAQKNHTERDISQYFLQRNVINRNFKNLN